METYDNFIKEHTDGSKNVLPLDHLTQEKCFQKGKIQKIYYPMLLA